MVLNHDIHTTPIRMIIPLGVWRVDVLALGPLVGVLLLAGFAHICGILGAKVRPKRKMWGNSNFGFRKKTEKETKMNRKVG